MPVLHLVRIMPSYSRKTINRMHTKINITGCILASRFLCWNWNAQRHLGFYGNFNLRNTGKQIASSNLSCTLVIEEGRQISKRLSCKAKFKREVIRYAEDKGNRKAAAIFRVDESNVRLWRKHKVAISKCEASRKKFTGPKKGRFHETDDAVFTFFQKRRKTGLFVSYDLVRDEAIKKARLLSLHRSRFKASKG
jgi:hypothetical protein